MTSPATAEDASAASSAHSPDQRDLARWPGYPPGYDPRRSDIVFHCVWLALALVVVGLAMSMRIENGKEVFLPGMSIALPETCNFRRMLGIDCAGCGLTRSFISLGHGDAIAAFQYNPSGILLFGAVLFQLIYRPLQLRRVYRNLPSWRLDWFGSGALIGITLLMVVQWILRIVGWC